MESLFYESYYHPIEDLNVIYFEVSKPRRYYLPSFTTRRKLHEYVATEILELPHEDFNTKLHNRNLVCYHWATTPSLSLKFLTISRSSHNFVTYSLMPVKIKQVNKLVKTYLMHALSMFLETGEISCHIMTLFAFMPKAELDLQIIGVLPLPT